MKTDVDTLSGILVAHRRAMALYRKEYVLLGRNAIEVMLYTYGKSGITASEVSRNLLHSNITQTKRVIKILTSKSILWSFDEGVKGKPKRYHLTDTGIKMVLEYTNYFDL